MVWIETLAIVIQAVAIASASVVGIRGLNTWQREMVARRRADLAEHTLTLFYRARDTIAYIRMPTTSEAKELVVSETHQKAKAKLN